MNVQHLCLKVKMPLKNLERNTWKHVDFELVKEWSSYVLISVLFTQLMLLILWLLFLLRSQNGAYRCFSS